MNFSHYVTVLFWFIHFLLKGLLVTGELDVSNTLPINDEKKLDQHFLARETATFNQLDHHILAGETPTFNPSRQPSRVPSRKPSNKPTVKATAFIYGNGVPSVQLSEKDQQIMCGVMTILLFVFMALELLSPEVLFLLALIVLMLTQVLTLTETLSGKKISNIL